MSLSKFRKWEDICVPFGLCNNLSDVRRTVKKIQNLNYQAPFEFMNYALKDIIDYDQFKRAMEHGNYLMVTSANLLLKLKDKLQKPLDGMRGIGVDENKNIVYSDPCTVIQAIKLHHGHYYENYALPKDLMEDLEDPNLQPPFLVIYKNELHWFPASRVTPGKHGKGWNVDSIVRTVDDQSTPVMFFAPYSSEERNEYSRVLYDNCEYGRCGSNIDYPFTKFEYSQESLDAMEQFPLPPMLDAHELPDTPSEASSGEEWNAGKSSASKRARK